MVKGVILVGAACGSATADHDAGPVPDFQVAAQHGTGEAAAGVGVVPTRAGGVVVKVAGRSATTSAQPPNVVRSAAMARSATAETWSSTMPGRPRSGSGCRWGGRG